MKYFRLFALALPLFACSIGPDFTAPQNDLPAAFANAAGVAAEDELLELGKWWQTFEDPLLDELIEEAIQSNLNLQLAQARVREARALVGLSRSDFFPNIVTTSEYERTKSSENARQNSSSTDFGSDVDSPTTFSTEPRNLYQAGFDTTWELDIFGGTRRRVEAALDTLQAQIEARRNTLVSLLAEVAQNYVLVRGLQHQLTITHGNAEAERETLEIQRQRLDAGLATALTVAQAEAQLQSTLSQVPALEAPLRQAIHRLGVLLGKNPSALQKRLLEVAPLPTGPKKIPLGLPSELLRRRPDIRQAERELAAATAAIGVATADLFPRLTLTGDVGLRSNDANNLFDAESRYYTFGPSLRWNILSWYAILDNIEVQNARQEQALIRYRQAVLRALEEVENALVAYEREQARYQELEKSVAANRRALDLAKKLYTSGVVDFLNVINAQQALFVSEDSLSQSARAVSGNLITLYKALGGGWETLDEATVRSLAAERTGPELRQLSN